MIELLILGLLKESPLHGYKLKRRLESIVGYFGTVSYGSLYPMLRKLEERCHVIGSVEEQASPHRIVYQITSEGQDRFLELMRYPSAFFSQKMLFFQSISPSDRKLLLKQQREEWVHKLDDRRRDQERIAKCPVDHYRAALVVRAIEHLEGDIAWSENLIKGEDHL